MRKLPVIVCLCLCLSHVALACGKERWAVKTLADANSAAIDFNPLDSSVERLMMPKAPKNVVKLTSRVRPTETHVWRVSILLLGYKLETDGDYHLVIASPSNPKKTMIAEIPDPACMPEAYRPQVSSARQWIDSAVGKPDRYKRLPTPMMITLTGVGFFDVLHGQTGVAPNGVELHPVLSIEARDQGQPVLIEGEYGQ